MGNCFGTSETKDSGYGTSSGGATKRYASSSGGGGVAPPSKVMTPSEDQRREQARIAAEERARKNAVRGTQRTTYVYQYLPFPTSSGSIQPFMAYHPMLTLQYFSHLCFFVYCCGYYHCFSACRHRYHRRPKSKPKPVETQGFGKGGPDIAVRLFFYLFTFCYVSLDHAHYPLLDRESYRDHLCLHACWYGNANSFETNKLTNNHL